MTDPIDFESRLQARLLAHTADVVRPFDAAAISSSVAARTRPTAWSMRTPALSRRVTVGLVTVLALAMAAVVVGIAANRGPRPIGDGERLFASGSGRGGWAYIVQDGALATFKMPFGRLQPWCPHLIPRTTVIDQVAWGGRDLIDLVTGRTVATIPTRYAGFERWSPDGRRLLLGDFGGRVGIVTFDDVATPVTRWFDAPGLENADWSRESDLVAVSRIVDGRLVIEVIDAARGATSTVLQARLSDLPDPAVPGGGVSVTWSSRGHVAVSIDHPDLTTRDVVVVDTADGTSTTIPNLAGGPLAWSPDGSRFAMGGDPSTISIVEASGARSIDVPVASGSSRSTTSRRR